MQLVKRPSRAGEPGNGRSGIAERTENTVVWWGGNCLNASEGVERKEVKKGDEYQTAEGEEASRWVALLRGQILRTEYRASLGGGGVLMAKEDLVANRPTWVGELGPLYHGKKAVVWRTWKVLEICRYWEEGGRDC